MGAPLKLVSPRISIEQAKQTKWAMGRKKYGPVFATDPIVELFDELIDGMNYVDEALRQDAITKALHNVWHRDLEKLAKQVRQIVISHAAAVERGRKAVKRAQCQACEGTGSNPLAGVELAQGPINRTDEAHAAVLRCSTCAGTGKA
jgi:hypothetical protein